MSNVKQGIATSNTLAKKHYWEINLKKKKGCFSMAEIVPLTPTDRRVNKVSKGYCPESLSG